MKKGEFIRISKRMVKEYFNRYICELNSVKKISVNDVEVVGFSNESDSYRLILQTPDSDDLYYGVTYNKDTDTLYSYTYKKVGRRINGKKINRMRKEIL